MHNKNIEKLKFYLIQKIIFNKRIYKEYYANNSQIDIGYNKFTLEKFFLNINNKAILIIKDCNLMPYFIYYFFNKLKEKNFNIILIDWNNEILKEERFLNKYYTKNTLENFLSQVSNKDFLLNLITNIMILICDLNMAEANVLKKMVLNKILEKYVERVKLKDIKSVMASVVLTTTYENEVRNTIIKKIEKILNDELLSELEIDFTAVNESINDILLSLHYWKDSSLKILVQMLILETLLINYKKENNYILFLNSPAYIYNMPDIDLKEKLLKKIGDIINLKIPVIILLENLNNEVFKLFYNYFNYIILTKNSIDTEFSIFKKILSSKILNELTNKLKLMEEDDILITDLQNLIYILKPNQDEALKIKTTKYDEEIIYFDAES
ncbi:MAG: hypothetical protein ACO2OV_05905 [Thermoproteota archaeon]